MEDEQDSYRDFKESYEYLRDFFNGGQIKNFREAHAAVELYKNNQSQIHDDEVKRAADAMSKILAMAEPYEKIRTLSTLRSEFMDKYNALKAQEISPAKDYVAGCYDRILQYLDTDQCKQRFQSAVEAERDAAVSKVENVQNLNDLVLLKANANTNKIQWFNKIDDYKNAQQPAVPTPSPSSNQGGTAPAPVQPTPVVRRRVTVSIQDVTPASWQINTTAELDDYIEKLRRALEQKLYDALMDFESNALSYLHSSVPLTFMMSTLLRQASSCIFGLAPLLKGMVNRRLADVLSDYCAEDGNISVDDLENIKLGGLEADFRKMANYVIELSENLPQTDEKLDRLFEVIENKSHQPNNKIILFSSFRHTLRYLEQHLVERGYRVAQVYRRTWNWRVQCCLRIER